MVRDERRGGARWLTLDEPARLNALTGADYRAIRLAVAEASTDPDARAVVLTGEGRAFCSGADRSLVDGSAAPADLELARTELDALIEALGACEVPVLAAVNGLAVGFGCTMLLHCDLVLAAESARFRFPFTALGMVPEAGSSGLLPARARWPDAFWSMVSSEWFDAGEARDMGLVWRVVPDAELVARAEEAVAVLEGLGRVPVNETKRLLRAGRAELTRAAMAREYAALGQLRPRS